MKKFVCFVFFVFIFKVLCLLCCKKIIIILRCYIFKWLNKSLSYLISLLGKGPEYPILQPQIKVGTEKNINLSIPTKINVTEEGNSELEHCQNKHITRYLVKNRKEIGNR